MSVQVKGSGTIGGLDEGLVISGIVTSSTQVNVGSNIKLGNAGVITATSFVGSGANLTSLPSQLTLSNNADNRVITGGSGTNLNGESTLSFNTSNGLVCDSGTIRCNGGFSSDVDLILNADANGNSSNAIIFKESGTETARIDSNGKLDVTGGYIARNPSDSFTMNGVNTPHYGLMLQASNSYPVAF